MPNREPQAISLFVTYWEIFLQQIRDGDVIVLPTASPGGSTVAIGRIIDPYEWHPDDPDPHARHRRPVRWIELGVPRRDLHPDLRNAINSPGTITAIRKPNAAQRLLESSA